MTTSVCAFAIPASSAPRCGSSAISYLHRFLSPSDGRGRRGGGPLIASRRSPVLRPLLPRMTLAGGSDAAGLSFTSAGGIPPASHDGGAGNKSRCSVKAAIDAPAAGGFSGHTNVKSIGSRRPFHAGTIARPPSTRTAKPNRNLQRTEAA